ncbi:NAD(P)H-dependent oxidoreductase (plasmid) [Pseudomonas silvicola]|nr:NAD(P)H-dependent oxidoreductase [Pseudomonas silvicola]
MVSPEYAHGVTGVIKNALDWIVSSGEFLDKPVSMPNLSVRAHLASTTHRDIEGYGRVTAKHVVARGQHLKHFMCFPMLPSFH